MKKIIILIVLIFALVFALAACQQSRKMELEEMNITQGIDGELSIQFPLHYDSMKINISIDEGDTWYDFDDNSIIFTYNKQNDTLSHSSGLTLNAPQDYTFKAKYVALSNDYLDSDVITESFRVKKPQFFSGSDEGATDYYHSIIISEKYFTAMYEDDDGYDFQATSQFFLPDDTSYQITYNRCVVADFEVLENETRVSLKNYKDGELSYNDKLEMRLYASSESMFEGLSDWVTATADNYIAYNLHPDYAVRLYVRLKETNDYLASDMLLAVLSDDGIQNESILSAYEKMLYNWFDFPADINYSQHNPLTEILRGIFRQAIISELEEGSIDVELHNILSCTKNFETENYELRGYIFEFYTFDDALAFYNFKNTAGKNVRLDGKYVAEVRKFDGDTASANEIIPCDDTTFFDAIGFNAD